ncbi:hypothetical protein ACHAO9_008912 [Fusarium lateritium]
MRVHTFLGPLILSAGLCAARACAPHPRSSTTSSWTSKTATSTAIGSTTTEIATTTSGLTSEEPSTVTESDTTIESSSPPNGDFEDPTLEPWESTGTTAVLVQGNACYEKNQCAKLPGPYSGNTAKICQRVEIQQGYEYTFAAYLKQRCTYYSAGDGEDIDCRTNAKMVQLSVDGVSFNSKSVDWDNQYHEYSSTFQYTGPSIDSTDLCIAAVMTQGDTYEFLADSVSLVRGKSVPVPEES